jgi:hypothetical protein
MPAPLPESLVKGLRDIASLPRSLLDEFLTALRALPFEIQQNRVFSGSDFKIASLPDGGQSIKEAAFSLLISRADRRVSLEEFLSSLIEAISLDPAFDKTLTGTLHQRIAEILSIENLDLIARAHDVLLEHPQTFASARIVSDIRPVFGDSVDKPPAAAVLVHMLNIAYYSARRRERFAVALDEKDLDKMIDVLERARTKAKTLRSMIKAQDIPYIEVK